MTKVIALRHMYSGSMFTIETVFRKIFSQLFREACLYFFLMQLSLQLNQEFIGYLQNNLLIEWSERNNGVEPVAKLGGEKLLDVGQFVT